MIGRDIFNVWAPRGAKWIEWVRPVSFVAIDEDFSVYNFDDFKIPKITYIDELFEETAIIVDLPDDEGIKEGIGLAKLGYRPIPLYNGTEPQKGVMATVDNQIIEAGLIKGSLELKKLSIENEAPPVFLLDSNRVHRYKMNDSVFDNSWDIYEHDMPSAEYLVNNGVSKIIVVGNKLNSDLKRILYKFQKVGIKISFVERYAEPKEMVIKHLRKCKYDKI